jgi:hypothetical protein
VKPHQGGKRQQALFAYWNDTFTVRLAFIVTTQELAEGLLSQPETQVSVVAGAVGDAVSVT